MSKFIVTISILFSIFISSCTKEELQYQDRSKKLYTYYVSTQGNEAYITYLDKNGINYLTQKNDTWHHTFNVNRGDTIFLNIKTTDGCTLTFYAAFDGQKQYYFDNFYLGANHQTQVSYIIQY